MNLLLDTHIFLWLISGDTRLPLAYRDAILDFRNDVRLSVVSLWEAMIKYPLGKLPLPMPPEIYLPQQRQRHSIGSLIIDEADVAGLAGLPSLHRDPFDRLLICQALRHGMTIVTADHAVRAYPARFL